MRRQISPEQRKRVEALNLDSIGFIKESKRFYPNRELGAHVLGWVGIDNKGLSGLEYRTIRRFAASRARSSCRPTPAAMHYSRAESPATAGSTVELTIDEYLQHIAERELHDRHRREPRRRQRRDDQPAHRRDPRDGERADVQPERVSAIRTRTSAATAPCRISTSRDRRSRS